MNPIARCIPSKKRSIESVLVTVEQHGENFLLLIQNFESFFENLIRLQTFLQMEK